MVIQASGSLLGSRLQGRQGNCNEQRKRDPVGVAVRVKVSKECDHVIPSLSFY
jgi:hypothetical protein